jgi:serine/threonine protein kinase
MAQGLESLLTGHTLVKRYTIEEVIGRGGFAVVYRAMDERLSRPVAVKVITLTATDPEHREVLRERLHKEAQAAASLPHHPNLVTVHDVGTDPELGLDFLVMEMLRGENLAQSFARAGRPPLKRALCILRDAAEGLAVGHRAGLIHRDVKPGNIFLAEAHDGNHDDVRVCLLDYGIAQAIEDDQTVTRGAGANPLSPAFASPEQIRGERELTAATDVFSLGVVGYQLLTGERPFTSQPGQVPTGWTVRKPIRELNPEVPTAVEQVVMKAMSVEPRDRFADADAFSHALQAATRHGLQGQVHAALGHISVPPPELGLDDDDEGTVIAPAPAAIRVTPPADDDEGTVIAPAPVAPARPASRPPAHVSTAAHTVPPSAARPRSRWPVVLVVALLLVAAAAWAALSGGGGDGGERAATPTQPVGEADDAPVAGTTDPGVEPGGTAAVPLPRDGFGVGGDGSEAETSGGDEPSAPVTGGRRPSASVPPATSTPAQQPTPSQPQPQRPATQQPQPQRPAAQQPQPQRPAAQPQRPPAQQPPPVQQQPPQQPPPQQEPPQPEPTQPEPTQPEPTLPEPPVLGTPIQPRPDAPRDTIRIGFPPR